ncbi:MAG: hypothetical protein MJ146_00570 [Clostridia bacterium]|nr:hypothetical protein [Clostridia bacterium]
MKYLPILGELLSSDSVIFMVIGVAIAAVISMKKNRKSIIGMGICLAIYAACEVASQMAMNYLLELIALVIGTMAIGGFVTFLIGSIVSKIRN